MQKLKTILLLASFISPTTVFGALDLRFGYAQLNGQPSAYEDFLNGGCSGCGATAGTLQGLGLDALYYLPDSSLGIGLRYQQLSASSNSGSFTATQDYTMFAAMAAYRLWDEEFFGGPRVSVGIADSSTLKINAPGYAFSGAANNKQSYSVGFELGYRFPFVVVGAELAFSSIVASDFRNTSGATAMGGAVTLDKISRTGLTPTFFAGLVF